MRSIDTYIQEGFYSNTGSTQLAIVKKLTEKVQSIYSKLYELHGDDYDGMNFLKAYGRADLMLLLDELMKYPEGTGFRTQFSDQGHWHEMIMTHDEDRDFTYYDYSTHTHVIDRHHLQGLEELFSVDLKLPFEPYIKK